MAHATRQNGVTNYTVALVAGHHRLAADESVDLGGRDAVPGAHELLCAALGACAAITLRMYAEHKEWPLRAVTPRRLSGRTADAWQRIASENNRGPLRNRHRTSARHASYKFPVTLLNGATEQGR